MKKVGKQIVFIAVVAIVILFIRYFAKDFICFETVNRNKEAFIRSVEDQYLLFKSEKERGTLLQLGQDATALKMSLLCLLSLTAY
jgi:hypothetical protein